MVVHGVFVEHGQCPPCTKKQNKKSKKKRKKEKNSDDEVATASKKRSSKKRSVAQRTKFTGSWLSDGIHFSELVGQVTTTKSIEIGRFMCRHRSLIMLSNCCDNDGKDDDNNDESNRTKHRNFQQASCKIHKSAIESFASSQMERLTWSSRMNKNYQEALAIALLRAESTNDISDELQDEAAGLVEFRHRRPLSTQSICQWHSILCGNLGFDDRYGDFEDVLVPIKRKELDCLIKSLGELDKWLQSSCDSNYFCYKDAAEYYENDALTYAATVFFAIMEISPFSEKRKVNINECLAEIAVNWTLRRAGFPLVLSNICGTTPQEEKEYSSAMDQARQNWHCTVTETTDEAQKKPPLLPLALHLADRMANTIHKFETIVSAKTISFSEKADSEAIKEERNTAAKEGCCIICMQPNPNIATLCCGGAVHLNCIVEWMAVHKHDTCVACRKKLPKMYQKASGQETTQDRPGSFAAMVAAAFSTAVGNRDRESSLIAANLSDTIHVSIASSNSSTTSIDDTDTDTSPNSLNLSFDSSDDDDSDDDSDDSFARLEIDSGNDHDENSSIGPGNACCGDPPTRPTPLRVCAQESCRNTHALTCSNSMCASCCARSGVLPCERHNRV